jgi:hypothetical protein
MGLIIQIALGIVLAWYVITRFEAVVNVVTYPFKILFWPFKFLWVVVREVVLNLREIIYGLVELLWKLFIFILPYVILLAVIGGALYVLIEFVPKPYNGNILISIIACIAIASLYVMFKESYENYKSKTTSHWVLAGLLAVILFFGLIGILAKTISSYFSN